MIALLLQYAILKLQLCARLVYYDGKGNKKQTDYWYM